MKIACLGPAGTFSHEALVFFDSGADVVFFDTVYDCFDAVARGIVSQACVPVENSTDGSVGETLDCFIGFDVSVVRACMVPVRHNLIGCGAKDVSEIRRLFVHPKAYAQCRNYIRKNLSSASVVYTSSNAMSAKMMEKGTDGAIAPFIAAKLYGRDVIAESVEDCAGNVTEFMLVSACDDSVTGSGFVSGSDVRTLLVFSCVDRVGVLADILSVFAERGISLTKIESRPSKKKMGEYVFFAELFGGADDSNVREALDIVRRDTALLKVLGSYNIERV